MNLTLEQKIEDFEGAVAMQIFDAAEHLLQKDPPHNLGALRLLVGYFEPIAKYADGYAQSGSSKHYFVKGCLDVIDRRGRTRRTHQPSTQQLEGFYEIVRCGLAHGATLSFNVAITASSYALLISTDGAKFAVNPGELLKLLRSDLDRYIAKLRDHSQTLLRQNFRSRWDFEASV